LANIALLTDFGSTNTKIVAINLDEERIVGRSQAHSTVARDITIGYQNALDKLIDKVPALSISDVKIRLACSSAAGGLNLVVIGLVPNLTVKAARLAALGAGAKVIGNFSHKLNRRELSEIEALTPDIIMLAGGTDGGNEEIILHNAEMLTQSSIQVPVVVAGNKDCADRIEDLFYSFNRPFKIVDNVLSRLDKLNVEPSRKAIKQIFMDRIIYAKGLERALTLVDKVLMPTPMAVLKAAELLAKGTSNHQGIGELIVVDIGGATTDIHSIAHGDSQDQRVVDKGLPEPFVKRTVEGDLGLRYNAQSILENVGLERFLVENHNLSFIENLVGKIELLEKKPDSVPQNEIDYLIDGALAKSAASVAMERHAGRLEQIYTPNGEVIIKRGKDLTNIKKMIGVGGIFTYGRNHNRVLEGMLYQQADPLSLKPKKASFLIDKSYIMYAIGLLTDIDPDRAFNVGMSHLEKLT
jgi:uncharacterized protein (TIGR01319 family)